MRQLRVLNLSHCAGVNDEAVRRMTARARSDGRANGVCVAHALEHARSTPAHTRSGRHANDIGVCCIYSMCAAVRERTHHSRSMVAGATKLALFAAR